MLSRTVPVPMSNITSGVVRGPLTSFRMSIFQAEGRSQDGNMPARGISHFSTIPIQLTEAIRSFSRVEQSNDSQNVTTL
jgi:hypothetical protein